MPYAKNRIEIMGHLGADPEIKNQGQQNEWCSFRIAVSSGGYKTKDGRDIPEKTNWFDCAAFGSNINLMKFAKKGERIEVVGEMDCREVEKDGQKARYWGVVVREVYPIDTKVEKQQQGGYVPQQAYQQGAPQGYQQQQQQYSNPFGDTSGMPF